MEDLFYALIGICGFLVALRAIVFAARLHRSERIRERPERAGRSEIATELESISPAARSEPASVQAEAEALPAAWRARIRSSGSLFRQKLRSLAGSYEFSLAGKMILVFSTLVVFFGLSASAAVYFVLSYSLERQAAERASLTAGSIADQAALVGGKNPLGLRALVGKYARQRGVAYVWLDNHGDKISAHSSAAPPSPAPETASIPPAPQTSSHALEIDQRKIREVRAGPIRLGLWHDDFYAEIDRAVPSVLTAVFLVTCAGVLLVIYFAGRINRPIIRLVKAAKSISTGDLEAPSLNVDDPGEFGELSRALERLRSSVNAAMTRLGAKRLE